MAMESAPKVTEAEASASNGSSSNKPEIILQMDSNFHKDAVTGETKTFNGQQQLESILTPNKNTILRVNIMALQKEEDEKLTKFLKEMLGINNMTSQKEEKKLTNFVQEILDKCPSLLLQVNAMRVDDLIEFANNYKEPESGAGDAISSQPEIVMDRATADLWKVQAVEGRTESFNGKELEHMVTPNKNTILHIHFMALRKEEEEKSINFVIQTLLKCPSLLRQCNAKGATPLHVAAAKGLLNMVKALIDFANIDQEKELEDGVGVTRQMLRMPNKEGNTALHEAALHGHSDVVKVLIEADPSLLCLTNFSEESPLYIAALRQKKSVVDEICNYPKYDEDVGAHQSPGGKSALHAAIRLDNPELTKTLLGKKHMREHIDKYGWTALHHAAYYGCLAGVSELLKYKDGCAAYIGDKERGMTPLHLAAAQGHTEIMNTIMESYPFCYELVDKRGWNVLHFAMLSLSYKDLKSFLEDPLCRSLLYEKDVKGNTPLHVLATSLTDSNLHKILRDNGDCFVLNNQKICPADILNGSCADDIKKEIKELSDKVEPYANGVISKRTEVSDKEISDIKDAKDSHMVVAALAATVTFAAGFTLPGGYDDEGGAILRNKSSFQAFVVIDALALLFSVSALFIYFLRSLRINMKVFMFDTAFRSTVLSTVLIMVAFGTAIYAVLPTWLGIVACCIGLYIALIVINLILEAIIGLIS